MLQWLQEDYILYFHIIFSATVNEEKNIGILSRYFFGVV